MQHAAHQIGGSTYDIAIPKAPAGIIGRCLFPFSIHLLLDRMILIVETGRDDIPAAVRQLIFGKHLSTDQPPFFQQCHLVARLTELMRYCPTCRP